MNVDELLRETAPDPTRSRTQADRLRADVLARATSARRRSGRRPLRVGLAAAAVATIGVTGVAYATGTVPALVTSAVDQFGRDAGIDPADRPEMTQIADLELPDGSRFAAWAGATDGMWCTAYTDNWDGTTTGSGGAACGDGASDYDLNRQQIAWAREHVGKIYHPVLFGQANPGEEAVRVRGTLAGTGSDVDLTVEVDPATSAFSAVLPGTTRRPWDYLGDEPSVRDSGVRLEFLDADGAVTRTVDHLFA